MTLPGKILWAVFGNDDEPEAPSWYMPEWPRWRRQLWWLFFRNPLHNLCFYVLGIADKEFTSAGKYPSDVFVPYGWNWAVRRYKWLRLPFVSYQNRRGIVKKFYVGWRERGNFGFKLTFGYDRDIAGGSSA